MIDFDLSSPCMLRDDLLQRFAAGELRGAERRQVLEHLLAGCPECRAALRVHGTRQGRAENAEEDAPVLAGLLSSLHEKASQIERERAEAARQLERFETHPVSRQWTLIRNSARFDSYQFASGLLDLALEAIYDDARRSLELARMSRTIADRLEPGCYGLRVLSDLRARTTAYVGNALRATDALAEAEVELASARGGLDDGTGDPLLEAELLYFESSLARARRQTAKAFAKVRRSRAIYRELGDAHLEGRAILGESSIFSVEKDFVGAAKLAREAIAVIDAGRDPRLALAARHNLARHLALSGDVAGALGILESLRSEYARLGDRTSLAKLRWLEGSIHRERGEADLAESAFRSSIHGLAELALPYAAAVASLDLVALLASQGRVHELRELASEMLVVFRSLGIEREAIAAWLVFRSAADAETVTLDLVRRLSSYFKDVQYRPGLVFES